MTNESYEPTGATGDRDQPPTMDRMAHVLEMWDLTTDHPRNDGDYLNIAARLLAMAQDG